jgi:uncharacterized Tic20 family protein
MNSETVIPHPPTQDERIMAALAHVAVLLPLMGVIAPILIWATQREKSSYVAFQSLQALAYQLIMILAFFVGMACYMASFFGMFLFIPFSSSGGSAQPPGWLFVFPLLIFGAIFVGGAIFMLYGLIGAAMTLQGKHFRYVFLGHTVERYLKPQ